LKAWGKQKNPEKMNLAMVGVLGCLAENGPLLGQQRSTKKEVKFFP